MANFCNFYFILLNAGTSKIFVDNRTSVVISNGTNIPFFGIKVPFGEYLFWVYQKDVKAEWIKILHGGMKCSQKESLCLR